MLPEPEPVKGRLGGSELSLPVSGLLGLVCEGISLTTRFPARRKRGASGQFHILTGVVPKEGGACESL